MQATDLAVAKTNCFTTFSVFKLQKNRYAEQLHYKVKSLKAERFILHSRNPSYNPGNLMP